jgi:hypothetical protein
MSSSSTRRRVLALYKELHRLGRDYPDPKYSALFISRPIIRSSSRPLCTAPLHSYDFNARMRRMFESSFPPCIISFMKVLVILRLCFSSVENRNLTDPAEIEQVLRFGEYMKNGTHVHTHPVKTAIYIASPGGMAIIYRNVGIVLPPQISLSQATLRFERWW